MTIIGSAYVDIHANDKLFEKEVKRMVKDIGPQKITVHAKVALSEANSALKKFRDRNNNKKLIVDLELRTGLAEKQAEDFASDVDGKSLSMNLDIDPTSAWRAINTVRQSVAAHEMVTLNAELNEDRLHEQVREFQDYYEDNPINLEAGLGTTEAVARLQTLQAFGESNPIDLDADLDDIAARAQLENLTRDRNVNINARLNNITRDLENALAQVSSQPFRLFKGGGNPIANLFRDREVTDAMEGFTNATAGIVPLKAVKSMVLGFMKDLESSAVQAAKIGTVIGSVGAALGTAAGFAANLLVDLSQIVGVVSVLPAGIAAVMAATRSLSIAWEGFSDAMVRDPEEAAKAIAKLHPAAQSSAWALQKIVEGVYDATEVKYWTTLEGAVKKAADAIRNDLVKGMGDTAVAMAQNTKSMAEAVQEFGKAGGVENTFKSINKALQNAAVGTGMFSTALLTLTEEGSKKLPELGEYFSELGTTFNNFIQTNSANGNILAWVDQGVQRLQELGSIAVNTGRVIGSIGEAAQAAGIGGLTELAGGFELLAQYMENPTFQNAMVGMFRDSLKGVEQLAQGLGGLWDALEQSSGEIGDIFMSTSETMRHFIDGVSSMFTETSMMDGISKFFEGVNIATENLGPAFLDMGNLIGDLGEMGSTLVQTLVPGLNTIADIMAGFISGMKDGWIALNPVLNDIVHLFSQFIAGPIKALGAGLGGLMQIVSNVPAPFLALAGAMAVLRSPITGVVSLLGTLKGAMGGITTSAVPGVAALAGAMGNLRKSTAGGNLSKIGTGLSQIRAGIGNMGNVAGNKFAALSTGLMGVGTASKFASDQAKANAGGFGKAWAGAGSVVSGSAGIIKGALKGIGSVLGANLPLIAIAALVTVLASVQEGAREAGDSVQAFADNFNSATASMGVENIDHVQKRITELGENWFTDWGWADDFEDTLGKVGMSAGDVAKNFSGSKKEVQDYAGSWNHLASEMRKMDDANQMVSASGGIPVQNLKDLVREMDQGVIDKLGKTREQLLAMDGTSLRNLISSMGQLSEEQLEGINNAKTLKEELSALNGAVPDSVFKFAENGGAQTEGLVTALSNANDEVTRLNENYTTLNSMTASIDQKTSAFQDNLRMTGAETMTNTGGLKEYYASLKDVKSGFDKVSEATNGNATSLVSYKKTADGLAATFNFQTQAGRDLHDALGKQAEGIQGIAVAAYDTAIKGGDTVYEATQSATTAIKPMVDTVRAELKKLNFDDVQIDTLIDQMGLSDEDISIGLNVDGAEEARRQIIETHLAAEALTSGDWTAYVNVMSDEAVAEIGKVTGLGEEFTAQELEKHIKANPDSFNMSFDEIMQKIALGEDPMTVLLEAQDKISPAVDGAKKTLDGLKDKEVSATLRSEVESQVATISSSLATIKDTDASVDVKTNAVETAQEALAALKKVQEANPELDLTADISQLQGEVNSAKALIDTITPEKKTLISAIDQASPILSNWQNMPMTEKSAIIKATDGFTPEVNNFNALPINDKTALLKAIDQASPKNEYWNSLSFPSKMAILSAMDRATPEVQNWNALKAQDKNAVIDAMQLALPKGKAWNALGIEDKNAVIDAMDKASPKNSAWNRLPMNSKKAMLDAVDQASGVIHGYNRLQPDDKTSIFTIITKRIEQIQRNITTNRGSTGVTSAAQQLNGGIMSGAGIQTFANGGMLTKAMKSIQAHNFSRGSERHVAQIARGKYPYRVWAEPETGGEAYIPLSNAKRPRSLNILNQVARKFGYSLMKQFADGGIEGGGSTYVSPVGGIQSFATGGTTAKERAAAKAAAKKTSEKAKEIRGLYVDFSSSAMGAMRSFTDKISDIFGSQSSPVVDAVTELRNQLNEAVKSLKGSNKSAAARARAYSSSIAKQSRTSSIWKKGTDSGLGILDRSISNNGNLTKSGRYAKITLRDLEYAQEKLNVKLDKTKSILEDINSEYNSARSGLRGTLENGLDFSSLLGDTDSFGYRAPVTAKSVSEYAKDYNRRMNAFSSKLSSLRRAGYSPFLVSEIANMGLEDGSYLADSLLADQSFLKDINNSYKNARGVWGKGSDGTYGMIGGTPDRIAKMSADAMFGASKNITAGLVKGMEQDLKNIETLGRKMANSLLKGFKKALGIKSPSKVFEEQVDFIAQGLFKGMDSNQLALDKRVGQLINPKYTALELPTRQTANNGGIIGSQASTSDERVAVHVHPAAGMDETLIGKAAGREIQWQMDMR